MQIIIQEIKKVDGMQVYINFFDKAFQYNLIV